jgi:UTP--glucose-1-phosphate uridylyltransferase
MAESGKARWCLYLPGLCIHAVPVAPGSKEELHLEHPQTPPDFSFYHLELPSSKDSSPGQQALIRLFNLQHSLYSDEPSLEHHPAIRDSLPAKPPPEDKPTLRAEPLLEDHTALRPKPKSKSQSTLLPKPRLRQRRSHSSFPSKRHIPFRDYLHKFSPEMPSSLSEVSTPPTAAPTLQELAELIAAEKAFENTSTNVAASQMRNALNSLADTVKDEEQKKVRIQHWRNRTKHS